MLKNQTTITKFQTPTQTSIKFGNYIMQGVSKYKNRIYKRCNVIILKNYCTLKKNNIVDGNLRNDSKNIIYVIKCSKRKEIYIGCTQARSDNVSSHKRNVKLLETRKPFILSRGLPLREEK